MLTFAATVLRLWDTTTWKAIPLRTGSAVLPHPPDATALAPDEQTFVVGTLGGISVFSADTLGRRRFIPSKARQYAFVTAISPDGKHLLTGGAERMARVSTLADAAPVGPSIEHASIVLAGDWSADGRRFATAQRGGLICVWALPVDPLAGVALNPPGGLPLLSPSGKYAASQGSSFKNSGPRATRVYATADGQPAGPELSVAGQLLGAAFSPDEKELALLTGGPNALSIVDWRTGKIRQPGLALNAQPRSVRYSPSGEEIAVLLADGQIILASTAEISIRAKWSNEVAHPHNNNYADNGALRFSPDGQSLITYQAGMRRARLGFGHPQTAVQDRPA